jgi:hypothetical protein
MTRRVFVLVNLATGRIVSRGPLRAVRVQRRSWTLMYAKAELPFIPDVRIAPRLELVQVARESGAL